MSDTESGVSLNLHRPKATTRAKEEAPKSGQEIGRCKRFQTSDWILRPGEKERPGSSEDTGDAIATSREKQSHQREGSEEGQQHTKEPHSNSNH
jgi:hypothetical protein